MKNDQKQDYSKALSAEFPGYPCTDCASCNRCTEYFKKCKQYREWLSIVWENFRKNIKKAGGNQV